MSPDATLGRMIREAAARAVADGKDRELDVKLDLDAGMVLLTVRIAVQGQ